MKKICSNVCLRKTLPIGPARTTSEDALSRFGSLTTSEHLLQRGARSRVLRHQFLLLRATEWPPTLRCPAERRLRLRAFSSERCREWLGFRQPSPTPPRTDGTRSCVCGAKIPWERRRPGREGRLGGNNNTKRHVLIGGGKKRRAVNAASLGSVAGASSRKTRPLKKDSSLQEKPVLLKKDPSSSTMSSVSDPSTTTAGPSTTTDQAIPIQPTRLASVVDTFNNLRRALDPWQIFRGAPAGGRVPAQHWVAQLYSEAVDCLGFRRSVFRCSVFRRWRAVFDCLGGRSVFRRWRAVFRQKTARPPGRARRGGIGGAHDLPLRLRMLAGGWRWRECCRKVQDGTATRETHTYSTCRTYPTPQYRYTSTPPQIQHHKPSIIFPNCGNVVFYI